MNRRDAVSTSGAAAFLQCSTRHVQNLFWRGDIQGYFKGQGRGLMLYKDTLEAWKNRDSED
jgi:hypothetical protein